MSEKRPLHLDYAPPVVQPRTVWRAFGILIGLVCIVMAVCWGWFAYDAIERLLRANGQPAIGRYMFDASRYTFGVALSLFLAWLFLDRPALSPWRKEKSANGPVL